ncbi:MAG: cob(I)yrinic acid a,c-diamide adenosyltransferase [Gemmatimonadetes bacterium]|nr:MAG: cob(I)yrinic acid a,c-diamide adenosyltransferase [Gemmatimonadota bacterium]
MKIYTKTGDGGETGLFGGGRTPKDSLRVAAYGEVDELNAALGLARTLDPAEFADSLLQTIQRGLFTVGAELATPDPDNLRKALSRSGAAIGDSDIAALEDVIDGHESRLEPLKNFILPGGAPKAAALHLGRTVCRRAERAVVALARHEQINPAILRYLNRLSDLLFVLARAANAHAGRPDVKW